MELKSLREEIQRLILFRSLIRVTENGHLLLFVARVDLVAWSVN